MIVAPRTSGTDSDRPRADWSIPNLAPNLENRSGPESTGCFEESELPVEYTAPPRQVSTCGRRISRGIWKSALGVRPVRSPIAGILYSRSYAYSHASAVPPLFSENGRMGERENGGRSSECEVRSVPSAECGARSAEFSESTDTWNLELGSWNFAAEITSPRAGLLRDRAQPNPRASSARPQ